MIQGKDLWKYRKELSSKAPLIHSITNPISINGCANALLAIGAKPIMAQHPQECEQITSHANALACNLGNFDDVRAEAMKVSMQTANSCNLPVMLDLVGVACSDLRLSYAMEVLRQYSPTVIKGNLSEMKAIAGRHSFAKGIDVAKEDEEALIDSCKWLKELAKQLSCTILCSGKQDIITDGKQVILGNNGHEMMTYCTGTGCMLNVLTAAYLSVTSPLEACVLACTSFGVAAQLSYQDTQVPGSFYIRLFDWLYACEEETYLQLVDIEEVKI